MTQFVRSQPAIVLLPVAMVAGAYAAGAFPRLAVDPKWSVAAVVLAAGVVIGLRRPLVPYALLFAWFPLSDLVRKFGYGSPLIVLSRDALLVVATVLLFQHFTGRRVFLQSFSRCWPTVFACVSYFAVTGVSSAFSGWQIPLSAMRLYFGFFPLIAAGYFVATDRARLSTFAKFAGCLLSIVTLVGIIQAVFSPHFLNPATASSTFAHLGLYRSTEGFTRGTVFQPSGVFVETGRNANWSFVTFAFGLAILQVRSLRFWRFPVVAIGLTGVLISSARGMTVAAATLLTLVGLVNARFDVRKVARFAALALIAAALAILALNFLLSGLIGDRLEFLGLSLNPFSETSELVTRGPGYLDVTVRAPFVGGLFGRGLGLQSLGLRYLDTAGSYDAFGEGGFVSVAVETGAVGLALWLAWTLTWLRNLFRFHRAAGVTIAPVVATCACACTVLLFVPFWLGVNAIQDYVTNAAFFFASGIAAGLASQRSDSNNEPDFGSLAVH